MMSQSNLALLGLLIIFQVGLGYSRVRPRIVNGVKAELGEFPYQITLQKNGIQDCGGSILNENHVLTAAHCVSGSTPDIFQVIAGSTNIIDLPETASVHNVSTIWSHKDYEQNNSWNNDIAMLKVDPPFTFNKFIAPVELPEAEESYEDRLVANVTGFGRTMINTTSSSVLLKTEIQILNVADCQTFYSDETVRETNICARDPDHTTGFCPGDSGGPLSVHGKVIGLVSFSSYQGCANEHRIPQVFTRVTSFLNWIKDHMEM